eukprot:75784-Amphidinium_carterae.1
MLTLELEKNQFELQTITEQAKYMYRFATESREHHECFQQRMREEAKRMCSYMSEEGLESSGRLNNGTRARSQNCKVNLSDPNNSLVNVSAILLNEK